MDVKKSKRHKAREKSKRHKVQEGHNRDRISNLPKDILHCILSFLPTKYAVSTSVLSTRWKYLWTSIHNLEFCDELPRFSKLSQLFLDFVDRVFFYNVVSRINRFSLKCEECDETHFNQWISTVIECKIQEIDLIVQNEYPMRIPNCLFTCDTLRILKLETKISTDIPPLVRFSNLKVLHFMHTSFFGEGSTTGINLICPILEELCLCNCTWLKISRVDISAPALQKLTIVGSYRMDCLIKICAERLQSINLSSLYGCKYFLSDLSSLVDAYISNIRNVVHLPCNFPHCLFACEYLKILKIETSLSINIPSSTKFSTVKVIHLRFINFSSQQPMQQPHWTCPVLEEFVLCFCTWTRIKTIKISAPKLQMLKIEDREHTHSCDIDCEVEFNAPSIVSLTLSAHQSYKYSFSHLSSLVDASIHVTSSEAVRRVTLLRGIYNVKDLKLSLDSIETLSLPDVSTNIHTFSRLTHLTLLGDRPIKCKAISGRRFIDLLADMPNLEHLFIPKLFGIKFTGSGRITGTTPQDFLSHLKLVEIKFIWWTLEELWFVKFLIKSVSHELRISLSTPLSSHNDHRRQQKNSKKLEEIAKSSKCIIQYH